MKRPIVGAVRWDAWIGDIPCDDVGIEDVGLQVERSLGPRQFHDRLPFFGRITGPDSVEVRELTQEVMDAQIRFASDAGIDYWAMCWFVDGSGLDTARNLYLASRIRQQVKYCFIFFHQVLRTDFSRLIEEHFKNTNYQTVLGGRPLIYLFNDDYTDDDFRCFRAQALAVDLPNPYFVRMGYQPSMADRSFAEVDAVSEYAFPQTCGDPYPTLAQREEQHWEAVKSAGLHLIPSVSTGWDARPRIINPVTWYKYQSDSWCQQATPSEIAGHLRMALEWAQANPNTVDAGAIIIYAWNEFDEGGWICPTLFGGTDRLGAIRRVLVDEASDEGRNS